MMYALTVTIDELEVIREHLPHVAESAKAKRATGKPTAPIEIFAPNTGDSTLDEFMRAHHDPRYRPLPMPKGAPWPGFAPRPLRIVLEEAIDAAKRHGWPGSYSGNFAMPKAKRA